MKFLLLLCILFYAKLSTAQTTPKEKPVKQGNYPGDGSGEGVSQGSGRGNSGNSLEIKPLSEKFLLKGRQLLNNPMKDSLANYSARVFIGIKVNAKGKVIEVKGPDRGSTTSDSLLVHRAKDAALKAKFNKVKGSDIQDGKMIFKFYKQPGN